MPGGFVTSSCMNSSSRPPDLCSQKPCCPQGSRKTLPSTRCPAVDTSCKKTGAPQSLQYLSTFPLEHNRNKDWSADMEARSLLVDKSVKQRCSVRLGTHGPHSCTTPVPTRFHTFQTSSTRETSIGAQHFISPSQGRHLKFVASFSNVHDTINATECHDGLEQYILGDRAPSPLVAELVEGGFPTVAVLFTATRSFTTGT